MKKIFALLFSLFAVYASAQENTYIKSADQQKISPDSIQVKHSVLVIPFDAKMYMSQIDQQIGTRNNLNYEGIVHKMRLLLTEIVAFKLEETMGAFSFYQPKSDSIMKELHYTYTSVNYVYRPMPVAEAKQTDVAKKDTSKIALKIKNPFAQRDPKPLNKNTNEGGTRIENGQIVGKNDDTEKFMDVDLLNEKLFEELNKYYRSTWFVFLNQLDLLYSPASTSMIRIKVHYSIFNLKARKLYSGAAVKEMPAEISDLNAIKNDYFFPIATEINDKLRICVKIG